ncbi:MAG: hypothetical protein H6707_09740 [Deltaproteobacteria bacterium]|nr:hypothetical protein [Deltaproteobacteria bacterium]
MFGLKSRPATGSRLAAFAGGRRFVCVRTSGGAILLALLFSACAGGESGSTSDPTTTADAAVDTAVRADVLVPIADALSTREVPDSAIFVTPQGIDSDSCGARAKPCKSVNHGLLRAQREKLGIVALSEGAYSGSVRLLEGVDLIGGFSTSFAAVGGESRILGEVLDGQAIAVGAKNITRTTRLSHLTIVAVDATIAGASSYGLHLVASPGVELSDLQVRAGAGADGAHGQSYDIPAPDGDDGSPGRGGGESVETPEPILSCPVPDAAASGAPGTGGVVRQYQGQLCGSAGGEGGAAGIDTCGGSAGKAASGTGTTAASCAQGQAGFGGVGGVGGSNKNCAIEHKGGPGIDGCDGVDGSHGADATGGQGLGTLVDALFVGAAGGNGEPAKNDALGGGGGGGGGGGDCDFLNCFLCLADRGGGGGGGGSAGCPGLGGGGGQAGGGSFGVFLVGAGTISIRRSEISTANGGRGGNGGTGQDGGAGGKGAIGGAAFQDAGSGGRGGNGGSGGNGGNGGGGAGGPSVGIFVAEGARVQSQELRFNLGAAGPGGGGFGQAGKVGVRANIAP